MNNSPYLDSPLRTESEARHDRERAAFMRRRAAPVDNRDVLARALQPGQRVRHAEFGLATVLRVRRSDGAVFIRLDEGGTEGTCAAQSLRRAP